MAKRKQPAQSSTLHDFFSKPGLSSVSKKPKLTPEHKKARAHKVPFDVPPEDIIVIDDDDDEYASGLVLGRNASSDIEIVEGPLSRSPSTAAKARDSINTSLGGRQGHKTYAKSTLDATIDEQGLFGTQTLLLDEHVRVPKVEEQADDNSFGFPALLLPDWPTEDCTSSGPSGLSAKALDAAQLVSQPVSAAGPPTFDVCPSPAVLITPGDASQLPEASYLDDGLGACTPVPRLLDDEWGTGDDEGKAGALLAEDDGSEDANTAADREDTNGESEACPICGMLLHAMAALEIQQHVNACIDTISTGTPVAGPSMSTPEPRLPPLSPIQTPSPPTLTRVPSRMPSDIAGVPDSASKANGKGTDPGAFSVLMTSHKENEAWKEATVAEDRNFRATKANGGRRKAPFYKVLQGMPIAVDAFRYGAIPGVTAYFLTHAHSDHYTNLSANWKHGPIYCSQETANLIMHMLGVHSKWVHPLPMDIPTEIPDTGGVRVTLIEANHCPGSCLFLYEGSQTVNAGDSTFTSAYVGSSKVFRYLHCGDFRASPQHVLHPAIKGKRIDHVYLDTTYLDPKHSFPPQSQVISACAELARRIVAGESIHGNEGSDGKKDGRVDGWFKVLGGGSKESKPSPKTTGRTLVVVGTYSIGKERIVKAIAKALNTKVYSDPRKTAILRCQSDPELNALLTPDPLEAGIHLLPLATIASDRLKTYMERYTGTFAKVVGFRPTGWTFTPPSGTETVPAIPAVIARAQSRTFTHAQLSPMRSSTAALLVYGVPYSEHSSFFELTCFALSLDWGRMIATVNVGSESSRGKMAKWVERWEAERKKRGGAQVVQYRAPDYW